MINYDLTKIRAIVFDIDGVLSTSTIPLGTDGLPVRTVNIKDGYAIQLAVKQGLRIAIITGANTPEIETRYKLLGVEDIYLQCGIKIKTYERFKEKYTLEDNEILFVGDDIPDYEVLRACGCPCCPADADEEIKRVCCYVSRITGGNGVGRDVIEQVLRAQGLWMSSAKAFGW